MAFNHSSRPSGIPLSPHGTTKRYVDDESDYEEQEHEHANNELRATARRKLSNASAMSTARGLRPTGMTRSRWLALVAVCAMSVGSHFSTYLLGPLKSRLHREMGTSNSQFSLLVASFKSAVDGSLESELISSLNSTWTPLVAGLFVTRFGTASSSIATTGCVLFGQVILLVGVTSEHLIIMTLGLFIFGLGLTPLAVVQETLVSHLSPSHHLGISLALGLLFGKTSSFISSLISLPLADRLGDWAPFTLAVLLCFGSFAGNALRLLLGWGKDAGEASVKEKRQVRWGGVDMLGDVFWVYILLNVLSGAIWQPFLHLSANLVQNRYSLSESIASFQSSILLAGAIVLYPVVGIITDRLGSSTPKVTFHFIHLSSTLTLLGYSYLLLDPAVTRSPWPGMVLFALGHGMSTLLLVIVVPRLLPPHLIPLGLGLHKSMEMAASSLSQTLAGLWLDAAKDAGDHAGSTDGKVYDAGGGLLRVFWIINVLQLVVALYLWKLEEKRRRRASTIAAAEEYEQLPGEAAGSSGLARFRSSEERHRERDEVDSLDDATASEDQEDDEEEEEEENKEVPLRRIEGPPSSALAADEAEKKRGKRGFVASLGFIALVWTVFMATAWSRL